MGQRRDLNPLQAALVQAELASPEQAVPAKKKNGRRPARWGRASVEQILNWSDEALGTVRLVVEGVRLGETTTVGPTSWTPVYLTDKVNNNLVVTIRVRPASESIMIGHAIGEAFHEVTTPDIEPFRIPIGQTESGGVYTFKNKKDGQNDFRLQFVNLDTGAVVVLEIGFTIRDNTCWIHQQETYEGRLVMLSEAEAQQFEGRMVRKAIDDVDLLVTVVPTNEVYAHSDANPFGIFQECPQLIELAIEKGSVIPLLSDWPVDERPVWAPEFPAINETTQLPQVQAAGSLIYAAVMWFNGTLGWGFARTANGQRVYIHFANIREINGDKPTRHGRWPIVHGLQLIFVKTEKGDRGLRATVIIPAS